MLKRLMMAYPSLPLVSSMSDKIQPVQEPGELYHHSLPLLAGFLAEEVAEVVHQGVVAAEVEHQVEVVQAVFHLENLYLYQQKNLQMV
jgi:hypothetical protein